MERSAAGWRSALWARWLGWTVVFGLVFVGGGRLSAELPSPASQIVFFALLLIAAFLIGVRFPSMWWTAGPAAALLTLVTAGILRDYFGPQVPEQTSFGMATPQESLVNPYTLIALFIGLLVSAPLAVPAYAGVRWGRRREADAAVRGGDRSDADSRSERG